MRELDDPMHDGGAPSGEAVINENLAAILGVGPGDELRLSMSPSQPTSALAFVIVGVTSPDFESPQEKTVYLHLGELQAVTGKADRDAVDLIGVKLVDARDADAVAARLASIYPVEAFSNEGLVGEVGKLTSTFEGFAQMIGIVTLGVALLFVATVMMLVVNERTAELGALRALGVSRSHVFRLILAEAALITAVAAVLGILLGYLGAVGFDAYLRGANATRTPAAFHFTKVSWGLILQVSGLTALMSLFAGLAPAWRASRVNLLAALRSV
jgi:putative ABC transport system permease protein